MENRRVDENFRKRGIKKIMKKSAIEYTLLTMLVLAGVCMVYRVWTFDVVNTPLSYAQDGIGTLVGEKVIIEEGYGDLI